MASSSHGPKIAGSARPVEDRYQPPPPRQFNDFSVSSLDKAEEQARNDKFKRILGADIVNLGKSPLLNLSLIHSGGSSHRWNRVI